MRQFVICKFAALDKRTYTYHHDGEPVDVGDQVRVQCGKGERVVTVAGLTAKRPAFPTKPILGLAPPKPGKLL